MSLKIMPEIDTLPFGELMDFIRKKAKFIVERTQGDYWDDIEEWLVDAAELAHAIWRILEHKFKEQKR